MPWSPINKKIALISLLKCCFCNVDVTQLIVYYTQGSIIDFYVYFLFVAV